MTCNLPRGISIIWTVIFIIFQSIISYDSCIELACLSRSFALHGSFSLKNICMWADIYLELFRQNLIYDSGGKSTEHFSSVSYKGPFVFFICNSLVICCILCNIGAGGGRPSSVMSLGAASVGGHSHGHPASPIGVGSLWEYTDPRSPEPLVVRGGWLWLIWVVRWTT